MNFKIVTFLMLLLMATFVIAQDFERGDPIPVPEPELNTGGIGNFFVGQDFDGDGRQDLFIVNHNWNDDETEFTPRIYKYELVGDNSWELVWKASLDYFYRQNTWPGLTFGDLDEDGLQEVIWAPPEWVDGTEAPNPDRLIVFEQKENGGDTLGVYDGESNFMPNSKWTISSEDNDAVRPRRMFVEDMDGDDTLEVIFSDRRATSGRWYFGICSVDDIPDNGDGSETWKVESRGQDFGLTSPLENKYDAVMLSNRLYLFDEVECTQIRATGPNTYEQGPSQSSVLPNGGSWNGAVVVDIDNNAQPEIIVGSYWNTLGEGQTHGVYFYTDVWPPGTPQSEGQLDTLKGFQIADLSDYIDSGGYGIMGGAFGDPDQDGFKEYIFGSRSATPNGAIFSLEYTGPNDSAHVAENWELALIDSVYPELDGSGRWDEFAVANIDGDPLLEVLYTSSVPAGGDLFNPDVPQPIYVLESTAQLTLGPWQKVDLPYVFTDVFKSDLGGAHAIAVDKNGRIWEAGYLDGKINIWNPDGTDAPFSPITEVVVDETTIPIPSSRGLGVDIDGNIINVWNPSVVRINANTGEGMDLFDFGGSPLRPAIDDFGYIYIGHVVAVSPIRVLDPVSFELSQTITLTDPPSFARGMIVSGDGKKLFPGDLTGAVHANKIYTSEDLINYEYTDSIYTDNQGNFIHTQQTVTVDRNNADGTIWYSNSNDYDGTSGNHHLQNAVIMHNFDTMEYGILYMPEPRTEPNGPRGVAFSRTGDTLYVVSSLGQAVYRYMVDPGTAIEGELTIAPQKFELSQNYPNPFNPTTNIDFAVAKAGRVTLTVYNILGQKVVTLVDKNLPLGRFTIEFDASRYATGTYVYELRSDNVRINKKMLLVK